MKKRIFQALAVCCIPLFCLYFGDRKVEQPLPQGKSSTETIAITQAAAAAPAAETTPVKEYRYIKGCPLSKELQQGIFDICERYNVSFEFVMAVIEKESKFDVSAVSDDGLSVGLMQVQEKWHSELMEELGVSDLYNPLENVEVGVAILASYFAKCDDDYFVLMKYNGGARYAYKMLKAGKVSDYALEITETAIMYELQNGI